MILFEMVLFQPAFNVFLITKVNQGTSAFTIGFRPSKDIYRFCFFFHWQLEQDCKGRFSVIREFWNLEENGF